MLSSHFLIVVDLAPSYKTLYSQVVLLNTKPDCHIEDRSLDEMVVWEKEKKYGDHRSRWSTYFNYEKKPSVIQRKTIEFYSELVEMDAPKNKEDRRLKWN